MAHRSLPCSTAPVSGANGKEAWAAGGSVQGSRQLAATAQCWSWASAVGCCSQLVLHFTALQPYGPPICVSDPRKLGRITYFCTLVLDLQASWNTKKIPCNCIFVLEYRSASVFSEADRSTGHIRSHDLHKNSWKQFCCSL